MRSRRSPVLLPLFAVLASCAAPLPRPGVVSAPGEAEELLRLHASVRVPEIAQRRFSHEQLWRALEPIVDGSPHLVREEIGRSVEGRSIRAVRYGDGPLRVLLWSQMHGDESTATLALLDLFQHLAATADEPAARELRERLTVVAVPMLNPDGAERFQRRNAYGIDVNRDARALATPEARALRELHRRLGPHFGFNLHDQSPRIRVGSTGRTAAISLLAPPFDEARSDDAVRARAKRLASLLRASAEPLVPGHVARYDDTFNPRAFGDLMQSWGTSTVLIESGGWRDDPEKQYLRAVNFVVLLQALRAIASGQVDVVETVGYETLPENGGLAADVLVTGGTLVLPGVEPVRADLSAGGSPRALIQEVGDLREAVAFDTIDVSGLFLHFDAPDAVGPGVPLTFTARRGAEPTSEPVLRVAEGRRLPPR